jgi:hypothetical protein
MPLARRLALLSLLGSFVAGCGGGQYGHSRFYDPLGDEEDALAGAVEYDPVMVERQPEAWAKKKVTLFGIVTKRSDAESGEMELSLSVRGLEGRNLCSDRTEGSCRTTVTEREHARVRVHLKALVPEDAAGEISIGAGSLVRVIGRLEPDGKGEGGERTLSALYYRHWPRGYYVTTASAKIMRQ